jgi:hypothetical protein
MAKKRVTRKVFNNNDYKIIRQLYSLNKGEAKVLRLPINDARRLRVKRTNSQAQISFIKALSRIAAMW